MPRRAALPALLAALATGLAGCGGGDVFRTDRPILRMTLDEYRIVPQDVVARAGRMKFQVRNTGRLTHNLVVRDPHGPGGRRVEIARVATMQPGEAAEPVKATLAPGEYELICTIANHDDLGQYGTLRVQE